VLSCGPLLTANHLNVSGSCCTCLSFWATVCTTVRPMLLDHCPVCLSVCPVCDIGVLWPNGWMNQDETWHGDRPRPGTHCVKWLD